MRWAGPVSRAGSVRRDLGTSVKHIKNGKISAQLAGLAGLKIYHVVAIAGPAFASRDNTFLSLNFSFYITHKGLSDH